MTVEAGTRSGSCLLGSTRFSEALFPEDLGVRHGAVVYPGVWVSGCAWSVESPGRWFRDRQPR